jgi:2-iminobutanoate/2-iminopropanoate deaminase
MLAKRKVSTNNAPQAIGPYSQALVVGEHVYISAQIPLDPKTMDFVSDDILEQARQVLKNISALLEASGSDIKHVVKVEIFLTDINFFPAINEIFGEFFTDENPPVRQTMEVRALPRLAKIMMSCEAILKY